MRVNRTEKTQEKTVRENVEKPKPVPNTKIGPKKSKTQK